MALIFCSECGGQVSDKAPTCPHCGAPIINVCEPQPVVQPSVQPAPKKKPTICPDTYMTKSILVTIFCCVPFGIVAIVNASRVTDRFIVGDYNGALEASESANKWCNWAIAGGVVSFFISFISNFFYFLYFA